MDSEVLTESDIVILESILSTHLSKEELKDPNKVQEALDKIKDEIKNPKLSNAVINSLILSAIQIATIGTLTVVGVASLGTGVPIFCGTLSYIIAVFGWSTMIIKLSDRGASIYRRIKRSIEKIDKKINKTDDPEKRKYLEVNKKELEKCLEMAKKGKEEIRQTQQDAFEDHPGKTFASKLFMAN